MAEQKPASTGSLLMSWASEACFWLAEKRRVPPLAKVIALEPCMAFVLRLGGVPGSGKRQGALEKQQELKDLPGNSFR